MRAVVNANMARAIRAVTVERGQDPRDFALLAFGGGGPAHAADLARMLGIRRVILPAFPGVFTAFGLLAGDLRLEFVRALVAPLDALDLDDAANASCRSSSPRPRRARRRRLRRCRAGDPLRGRPALRRPGQRARDPARRTRIDEGERARLRRDFLAAYRQLFQYTTDDPVELVNLRVIGRGIRSGRLDLAGPTMARQATAAGRERRVLFDRAAGPIAVPVLARAALARAGARAR